MDAVKELLDQAENLSEEERKRLIEGLEESLVQEGSHKKDDSRGSCSRTLELAGSAETEYDDVSSDKYKHVAEAYAHSRRTRKL